MTGGAADAATELEQPTAALKVPNSCMQLSMNINCHCRERNADEVLIAKDGLRSFACDADQ